MAVATACRQWGQVARRLEGQDVPTKQAEAITAAIIEVLNDSLENVTQSFVSKAEMQKAPSQNGTSAMYEIDKVTVGQRLDLNLERGRIRDELVNHNVETTNLTNKLDQEIHALRAHMEAAKYDVIKYCIGTHVSISTIGLTVIRILM
ncbi:hypothetical protein CIPAW_08G135800 [Carya illinoinensis]|uniref:Uncharacterized protein n=1 Tax=Carya illinoinensis TaxID=32201 RepID=A0A8T1PN13_CARIL|nr:hypothetical protein CIPAW_08G135800 [Carya illinoinensis]